MNLECEIVTLRKSISLVFLGFIYQEISFGVLTSIFTIEFK